MRALSVFAGTCFVVGGCVNNASLEQRLIGTWAAPALYAESSDGSRTVIPLSKEVMEITFTEDNREIWRSRGKPPSAVARWHLEGNDLVFTLETKSEMGPPGTTLREKITKITADELVFTDGTTEGRWTRVR